MALDTEFADYIARVVFREVRLIQLLLADFTGVADHVGGKPVLRVEAALSMDQLHFRKEIAVRFDEGQLAGGELLFDDDGVVFGPGSIAVDARDEIVVIQVEAAGDGAQVLGFQVFAGENEAIGGVVINDDAPVAVEDFFRAGRGWAAI